MGQPPKAGSVGKDCLFAEIRPVPRSRTIGILGKGAEREEIMLLRSDGLLRGSREERIQAVLSLRDAEWNLATLLDLHCGLLDHAEDVRASAMDALQDIAKRKPKPLEITPMMLLSEFLFSFTAVSGMAVSAFEFFVQLDTPEARQAVGRALLRVQRNEDFSAFVEILQRANKRELLRRLEPAKLSKTKAAVVRSALHSANHGDR